MATDVTVTRLYTYRKQLEVQLTLGASSGTQVKETLGMWIHRLPYAMPEGMGWGE